MYFIKPLNDRVVIRRSEEKDMTEGGIIIPDTAKERPAEGKVVAVGPGKRDKKGEIIPMEVKAGDKVLYEKYAGTEMKIEGEITLFMRESDIFGVIEEEP